MSNINFSGASFWLDVGVAIWTVGITLFVWLSNRRKANQNEIDQLNKRQRNSEDRLLALEAIKEYLPSNEEIGEIHSRVDQVGQGLQNMEGQLAQINNNMQLIQEHLLAEKRK